MRMFQCFKGLGTVLGEGRYCAQGASCLYAYFLAFRLGVGVRFVNYLLLVGRASEIRCSVRLYLAECVRVR